MLTATGAAVNSANRSSDVRSTRLQLLPQVVHPTLALVTRRHVEFHDLRIPVRWHRARGEARELQRLHLIDVATGTTRDKADAPECLVRGTHDLAEGRRDRGVVEILEDHDLRPTHRGDL